MTPKSALVALILAGCGSASRQQEEVSGPLDLTVKLAPGQSRAGLAGDDRAWWAGVAAEATRGDAKIYNDRVQFAIQGPRPGDHYVAQGGAVVDADIVRPVGQPGRDFVEEWAGMAGLGRLLDLDEIEIVDDGRDSGVAVVRTAGPESPLHLLEGAIESPGTLIPDKGLWIEHVYTLPADSWLMEVTTTVTATDTAHTYAPGDVILGSTDAGQAFNPVSGYQGTPEPLPWSGYVGIRNEMAVGIFSEDGSRATAAGLTALSELLPVAALFTDEVTLQPGESASWTRFYGVGPDFATLTDAWQERIGGATETLSGTVTGPEGPVAGARVVVVVDDEPFTMALSAEDGSWSADVPTGSDARVVIDAQGVGRFFDLPEGWADYGHLVAPPAREAQLDSLTSGAIPIPLAEGYGWLDGEGVLPERGVLHVFSEDGLPFEVRVRKLTPTEPYDDRLIRGTPSWIGAWTKDGDIEFPLEPGTYEIVVHRGPRFERWTDAIDVTAGLTANQPVTLPLAVAPEGWLLGDPHSHSGPSSDADITMVQRLMVQAGVGLQLHFGTDHDAIGDYRPLLEPLGLTEVMNSVVATEMSPVLRGHLNLYPLTTRGDLPNGGAYPWHMTPIADTDEQMENLRARHGGALTESSGFAIQANHPEAGLLAFANWSPGEIGKPDFFSTDFDAIELMNAGGEPNFDMYADLSSRGYPVVPTGVSDAHGHFSGSQGLTSTWFYLGTSDPTEYTDDALRSAMYKGSVIASRGLFLDMSILPGSTVVGPQTLHVEALGPTWIQADRILLYRDGVLDQTVEGTVADLVLDPGVDASYIVVAEGDTPLSEPYSRTPYALATAIELDAEGDGWTPALPPLADE